MRKTLEQIKEIVKTIPVGKEITVLTPNQTRRNGSAPYYRRTGEFAGIETNEYGNSYVILYVGKNRKRFTYGLCNDWYCEWDETHNRKEIQTEYCATILDIWVH